MGEGGFIFLFLITMGWIAFFMIGIIGFGGREGLEVFATAGVVFGVLYLLLGSALFN